MPSQEVLRSQTTPEDVALIASSSYAFSPFRKQGVQKFTDFIRKKVTEPYGKIAKTGGKIDQEWHKEGTLLGELYFTAVLPALAIPGDGTYARYADFVALQLIEKVTLKYGSNEIYQVTPEAIFHEYDLMNNEQKRNFEEIHSGNLTAAERNTLATSTQKIRFKIPLPWSKDDTHSIPICALTAKPRVYLEFNKAQDIIQTDGTKLTEITLQEPSFEGQYIDMTGNVRQEITDMTMRRDGKTDLFTEYIRYDHTIASGSLGGDKKVNIDLGEIEGPVSHITAIIRTAAQIDNTTADVAYYDIDASLLNGVKYGMKAKDLTLIEEMDAEKERVALVNKYFCSGPDSKCLIANWSEYPGVCDVSAGHLQFNSYSKPLFSISRTVDFGEDVVITFIAHRYNWLNQQGGNLIRLWA